MSRLAKDAQDAVHLLRDEVAGSITGWNGQTVLDQLVPALVAEVIEHLDAIRGAVDGRQPSAHLDPSCRPLLEDLVGRLPRWRVTRTP